MLLIGAAVYLFPAFLGFMRKHPQKWPILLLVLFLGWTVIGWVGALIWAATSFNRRYELVGLREELRRGSDQIAAEIRKGRKEEDDE